MAEAVAGSGGGLRTADGRPLGEALAQAQGRARRRALLLVAPLLLFVLFSFVVPIGQLLISAFSDDDFARNAPALGAWFDENPRGSPIDESAYAALAADLKAAKENRTAGQMGERINYEVSGARSLCTSTARNADKFEPPYREAILAARAEWDNPRLWESMRQASSPVTPNFFLAAVDLRRSET
ncbi:MAG: hypothetical protein RL123_1487, partial [Pseudomonadota bacterium]